MNRLQRQAASTRASDSRRAIIYTIYCEFSLIFQRINTILASVELVTPRRPRAGSASAIRRSSSGSTRASFAPGPPPGGTTGSRARRSNGCWRSSGRPLPRPRRAPPQVGAIVALSGRNQLRGIVEEVRSEGLLAQVRLRIGDQTLTAIITRDAVDELKLRRGDEALAVIKSTEVMVARLVAPSSAAARATRPAPGRRRRR